LRTYTFLVDGEEEETQLTCGELDRQARAIATVLQGLGLTGGRALLLYAPGFDYIAALFGCLYAGVVAIPAYPPDPHRRNRSLPRLQSIARDAAPSAVLTTETFLSMREVLSGDASDLLARHWLATDTVDAATADGWQAPIITPDTLALLQYTSGSTGTPKGVMVSHDNLLHNLVLICQAFGLSSSSVGVIWLPPYHDMGLIGGLLEPLYVGFPVTLLSPVSFLQRPFRWLRAVSRYRATVSGGPNFAYDLCVRKVTPEERNALDLGSWEVAFNGAETIRPQTLERFVAAFSPCGFRRDALYPCYGLAEATLIVSGGPKGTAPTYTTVERTALERNHVVACSETDAAAWTVATAGRPVLDQRIVVAKPESLTRCLPDEVGEIWVSGPSVARGYWQRSKETARTFEAYLADTGEGPFLRTGDLGFMRDGSLFVTGRLKDLIVIRGNNHYAEDIERTVLSSHPALRPGCGAVFSVDDGGTERLVVVQEIDTRQEVDAGALVGDICQAVAEVHEVPVHSVILTAPRTIPKTSSGKVRRRACRAAWHEHTQDGTQDHTLTVLYSWHAPVTPDSGQAASGPVPPLRTAPVIASWLTAQLAGELGLDPRRIDIEHPISRYGIDSLAAIALIHRIETSLGVQLPIATFFDGSTLMNLATRLTSQMGTTTSAPSPILIPDEPVNGTHPLSRGQEALWFLHRLAPESAAYHLAHAVRVRGALDVSALRRAFQALVARHAALRSTFCTSNGEAVQRVRDDAALWFQAEDASTVREATLSERLTEIAERPFDLARGPLLRVKVFRRSPLEHIFLLVIHHLVSDFWSLAVLVRELGLLYDAEKHGTAPPLPPLAFQYTRYVHWQRTMLSDPEADRLWNYWRQQLEGEPPTLNLSTDRPRPPIQTYRGASHMFRLDAQLTAALRTFGESHGATLYMVLLAALTVLLHRYTGQDDIVVGSPTAGRTRSIWAGLMGYFVNTVALRTRLASDSTFERLLEQVRETVLGALEHQDYPFPLLVERLQPVRDPSRSPLFQVMFIFHRTPLRDLPGLEAFAVGETRVGMNLDDLKLESMGLEQRSAQVDLTLTVAEVDGGLSASLQYNTDLFDPPTIARMAAHFQTLLAGIVSDPRQRISTLPLLSHAERHKMLIEWNDTATDYPAERCVHQLFERTAAQTPAAVALIFEQEQLTYRELNRRANQLAHHLQGLGVGPDVLVGIFMERSVEMVVGLLGILKAGGAYVPLDPAYPPARLSFMAQDAQTRVLLTQARLAERLPPHASRVVCIDAEGPAIAQEPITNLADTATSVSAENLAYVIYTSGSTGRPKGVQISHRSLVNFLESMRRRPGLTDRDVLLAVTSLSFDIAALELFLPLMVGATVTLVSREVACDGRLLSEALRNSRATAMQATPTTWRMLVAAGWQGSPRLRILCGGEALPRELADELLERGAAVWNLYGPTETTIWSAIHCAHAGSGTVPIGRPINNTQLHVLDTHAQPVPVGATGELYIGGDGVARGYLGRPELTSERFIPNPFSELPGERLYSTGDVARYLPSGEVELLGRIDHQVKVRGFRIELGEIEAALQRHPGLRDGIVVASEHAPGEQRLVAYVVSDECPAPSARELRDFLKTLPDYMVPSIFVSIDTVPLTPNGKVDRRALPTPDEARLELATPFVAPRTPTEQHLASIWSAVLRTERIGLHDNFFEAGGDSLKAAQLASRMSTDLHADVPVGFILLHPTIAAAAEALERLEVNDARSAVNRPDSLACASQHGPQDGPAPDDGRPFVRIERRPLLSLFAAGKIPPVRAAAFAYFPAALVGNGTLSPDEVIHDWCANLPVFAGIHETSLGRIATLILPRFDTELYDETDDLVGVLVEALELAARLGARTASLTGLLPSATDYGRRIAAAVAGRLVPQVTTGHATTTAAVVLSIERMLSEAGRDLSRECVGFLGLGSIGIATLRLMLRSLPHPREIVLCDVYRKRQFLEQIQADLAESLRFQGSVRVIESRRDVPPPFYDASVIIGATNVPDILEIDRLRPGTIIVDDSAPHCFPTEKAILRLQEHADILFGEGGVLEAPEPIRETRYLPYVVEHVLDTRGRVFLDRADPRHITGCIFSSVLSACLEDLQPTVGLVDEATCGKHFQALGSLRFRAAAPHCDGYVLPQESIRTFRSRFGVA
jgi:amino acid adenylation domain-containing protein